MNMTTKPLKSKRAYLSLKNGLIHGCSFFTGTHCLMLGYMEECEKNNIKILKRKAKIHSKGMRETNYPIKKTKNYIKCFVKY